MKVDRDNRFNTFRSKFMVPAKDYSIDKLLSEYWHRNIAHDLAAELQAHANGPHPSVDEVRRLLAIKAHRELMDRLEVVTRGKSPLAALKATAIEMRSYALERPALSAATLRAPNTDSRDWRQGYDRLQTFVADLLAKIGLFGVEAKHASRGLQSLARGFVVHELMNSFQDNASPDDAYECAVDMFVEGLQAVSAAKDYRPIDAATDFALPMEASSAGKTIEELTHRSKADQDSQALERMHHQNTDRTLLDRQFVGRVDRTLKIAG